MAPAHDPDSPRRDSSQPAKATGPYSAQADVGRYAGIGIQFVVVVVVFAFAGRWLDGKLGTTPWLLVVGVLLGSLGATIALIRAVTPSKPDSR
jgi:F0F1-type ATP synthase assembly protein I